jgi:hypothetical protein
MKRPLIREKDFHNFHWIRGISSKKGHQMFVWEEFFYFVFFLEEEENECVRG